MELVGSLDQELLFGKGGWTGFYHPGPKGLLWKCGLDHLEDSGPEVRGGELHGRQRELEKALNRGEASYFDHVEKSIFRWGVAGKTMEEKGFRG